MPPEGFVERPEAAGEATKSGRGGGGRGAAFCGAMKTWACLRRTLHVLHQKLSYQPSTTADSANRRGTTGAIDMFKLCPPYIIVCVQEFGPSKPTLGVLSQPNPTHEHILEQQAVFLW